MVRALPVVASSKCGSRQGAQPVSFSFHMQVIPGWPGWPSDVSKKE